MTDNDDFKVVQAMLNKVQPSTGENHTTAFEFIAAQIHDLVSNDDSDDDVNSTPSSTSDPNQRVMTIVTHPDKFHADEVMAIAILTTLFEGRGDTVVIQRPNRRTPMVISASTVYVDTGRVYNHLNRMYDHHQTTFQEKWDIHSPTPLSSCGLIWKHYGLDFLQLSGCPTEIAPKVMDRLYKNFFLAIDANDNGITICRPINGVKNALTLPYLVSQFNGSNHKDHDDQMSNLCKAVDLCASVLTSVTRTEIDASVNYANEITRLNEAFINARDGVMVLDFPSKTVDSFLRNHDPDRQVVQIYITGSGEEWSVKTVPYSSKDYMDTYVKIIPHNQAITLDFGRSVLFIHTNRFLAKTTNQYDAVRLANASISEYFSWRNQPFRFVRYCSTFFRQ